MDDLVRFDLAERTVRDLNQLLHNEWATGGTRNVQVLHPGGRHSIAVGVDFPAKIEVMGNAGYFLAAMNKQADVVVHGNVGWSVAENLMSGSVRVKGTASECAGASAHGGLIVIEGDASSRCGISLKGGEIVVGGDVGHMSAFMAQAGTLVICGNAGAALGDSLYEAVIYCGGNIAGLGADARQEAMTDQDFAKLTTLLRAADLPGGVPSDLGRWKRIASARTLYHWNASAKQEY